MNMRKLLLIFTLLLAGAFGLPHVAMAAEPTLAEVYQAAQAGRMREAQAMMDEVLRAHPNSAKAHYVEAELLAKQGLTARGRDELATAERLDPSLSFAKPAAVQELHARLSGVASASVPASSGVQHAAAPQGFPWNVLIIAVAVMAAVFFIARRFFRPNPVMSPASNLASGQYGPGYGPGYGQPGQPGYPGAPGGMGSGILGSLATGAAVGAGIVAGEALMHRVIDGGGHDSGGLISDASASVPPPAPDYDMGGSNFGVSDGGGSWDDNSGGASGGDW
jgi:hypothetical protein